MIESIICPSNLTTSQLTVLANITRGDSFKMVYHFYPNSQYQSPAIKLDSFNFVADYWIYGYETNVLHFAKSSISSQNCIVDENASLVKFLFQDYNLNSGKLYAKYTFTFSDREMPGGWATEVVEGYTGVVIK